MHSTILSSKLALVTLLISTLTNAIPIQERHLFKRAPLSLGLAKSFGALAYSTLTSIGATCKYLPSKHLNSNQVATNLIIQPSRVTLESSLARRSLVSHLESTPAPPLSRA